MSSTLKKILFGILLGGALAGWSRADDASVINAIERYQDAFNRRDETRGTRCDEKPSEGSFWAGQSAPADHPGNKQETSSNRACFVGSRLTLLYNRIRSIGIDSNPSLRD
ncbi:hypothetical protein Q31b_24240 [Novipirellula aureliae]|uniref:Uncharacterized protein n=1 Tax=Novipirellula aureliae TaxID=2527966 RepID=A0A5C6E3W6_9BACT|nr:hypothetical protein [Novipirellula aureliae]TWU43385.1 hypothetical protein Q31b_24240 [Novipirellula aureliae]